VNTVMNLRVPKMQGSSWVAAQLAPSQEGLSSMSEWYLTAQRPITMLARVTGLMITFHCLWFEIPLTWRVRSLFLHPPGRRWPSYTPKHWVPFLSLPTTRKATVEAFDPASTRYSSSSLSRPGVLAI
jgi:hypothetical protein